MIFLNKILILRQFREERKQQKIKKGAESMQIDLVRCPDILSSVAALETPPFTVGFAAETHNVAEYAKGKLRDKRLDMIVANRVGDGLGFDCDDNAVEIYWDDGEQVFAKTSKAELAQQIVAVVAERYTEKAAAEPRLSVIPNRKLEGT